jgi:hypothetical protein
MKIRHIFVASFAVLMLVLAGCQAKEAPKAEKIIPVQTQQVPSIPYSKGPDGPPAVSGPTSPPPSASSALESDATQPQAVTETEAINFSLPPSS